MATRADSTWIAIHDSITEHPKIEPLSAEAFRTFIDHLCFCHRQGTDGRISKTRWEKIGKPKARLELLVVQVGQSSALVIDRGDHYEIHDYLDWQRSADEAATARAAAADGGSYGNHKRWHEAKGIKKDGCRYCVSSVPRSVPRVGGEVA